MSKTHERRFGVEIECGFGRGGDRTTRWDACRNVLYKASQDKLIDPYWYEHIGRDGTLVEIRSPILKGDAGFQEVHNIMKLLREKGAYVTSADGMHVHHEAPEFVGNKDLLVRLVDSWRANLDVIRSFVATSRHRNSYCQTWTEQEYLYLKEAAEENLMGGPLGGRRDLNLSALLRHGTIEIRLHQGTLNSDVAEGWIRFGQAFLNKVVSLQTPMKKAETREELLQRLKASSKKYDALKKTTSTSASTEQTTVAEVEALAAVAVAV